ncbi:hypothetical protein HF888_08480 [Bermanella marisrubri]|uniref:Uncharacterized protein n=1 Tax=Bermanella marisrubri TaxID=207949 RepID=Q1MXT7_9GAMM|nr:hypothetical protein [Bermanella marisrubri]EAT10800.1 hypothetical protein RED65_08714 [Oceanobacter sp. RED65] [Bermanella marisrubri]QIZ84262.1 hypothetical protein HF888_08480 [Bermanella marisrubri]
MRILTLVISLVFFAGCDNSTNINNGEPEPITIKGTVLGGHLDNAQLKIVGVDAYGQPQRNDAGEYFGESQIINDGRFEAKFSGSYEGSLFLVALPPEDGNARIRCLVNDGCTNGANKVAKGEWYEAPQDFELWAAVNDAQRLEGQSIHLSLASHMGARLAFAQFVGDGTTPCSSNSCNPDTWRNALMTPQTIHNANSVVQRLFSLQSGFPVFVESFDGLSSTNIQDSVVAEDQVRVGLANYSLLKNREVRNESFTQTLAWIVESSFLENFGQLIERDTGNQVWDLATYYQDAIDFDAQGNSSILSAQTNMATQQSNLRDDAQTNAEGDDYSADLVDKVSGAKTLMANTQAWIENMEYSAVDRYSQFFGAEFAQEIIDAENKWDEVKYLLGPNLKSLFLPFVELMHYGLSCELGGCDASRLNVLDVNSVAVDSIENTYSYSNNGVEIQAAFSQSVASGSQTKFSIDVSSQIETTSGVVNFEAVDGIGPAISLALNGANEAEAIALTIPKMVINAKTVAPRKVIAEEVVIGLTGVKDVTLTDPEMRYNLSSISLPIDFVFGEGSGAEKLEARVNIESSNANAHYPAQQWPDLDIVINKTAFKNYAVFESESSGLAQSNTELAGFLNLPSDMASLSEVLSDGISYDEVDSLAAVPSDIVSIFNINSSEFSGYAELEYFGDKTAVIVLNDTTENVAARCVKSAGEWACTDLISVSSLGCGSEFGKDSASVNETMNFLRSQGCLDQVTIQGRGVYDIQYTGELNDGDSFDLNLNQPYYLGMQTLNATLTTRFKDGSEDRPIGLMTLRGAVLSPDEVSIGMSITDQYLPTANPLQLFPVGEKTLWIAVGGTPSDVQRDAVIFYVQNDTITIAINIFNYTNNDIDPNQDKPLGFIRYAGELLGSISKEGDLYIVRYVDGSWQII